MPVDPAVTFEACHCFAVRAAARHVTQFYDQFLALTGLRATQFTILATLHARGPLSINSLASVIVMDRTTLGRNILPLQRKGLVKIERAADDRRAKELRLTKAGEKRLQAAAKGWEQAQALFEDTFGGKRAAALRAMLRTVATTELAPNRA
jgi:DNA-binding MarR family transcriptional regulator